MRSAAKRMVFLFLLMFLSSPAFANWEAETPLSTPRDQFTGGVIDGKIYVFGGNGDPGGINLKSTEMFDPLTKLWTYRADNENNNEQGVEELTGAVVNGKLYVFGAYGGGDPYGVFNFVEEYDPVTNTWTSKAPIPTTRTAGTAALYNGEIYVFGGSLAGPDPRTETNVVEAYNPVTNSWRTNIAPMPTALTSAAVAVVGNKAYVFGGGYRENSTIKLSRAVMVYDFVKDTWATSNYAPLPAPRGFSYASAAPVIGGKVYLIGGWIDTGTYGGVTNSVEIYDTVANTWQTGPCLPTPIDNHLTVILNNTIYVIGGDTDTEGNIRTGEVWSLEPPANPIVGKWGFQQIRHDNSGTWNVESGTIVFNNDGTGSLISRYNDNGTLFSGTENVTYTTTLNADGSYSITLNGNTVRTKRLVLSDDRKMTIQDGTDNTSNQKMLVAIRMCESQNYTNADLKGDFYAIGYDYDSVGNDWPGNYIAWASTGFFDGNGSYPFTNTFNGDGMVSTFSDTDAYFVNSDGSILLNDGELNGYMSGNGELAIASSTNVNYYWEIVFGMKKGDRTYSTADLAGEWAIAGFGDDYGTSFNAEFGSMTCDSSGNCTYLSKNQRDGSVKYESGSETLSVASDGSFGASINPGSPSYAGAIGNNGNTILFNVSFNPSELYHREIFIGVRCSDCYNLAGQMIPMLTFNPSPPGGNGINIYLYDPASEIMNTIKENTNDSWMPSVNTDQTLMVYTEGIKDNPYTIKVYDIASKTSTEITTATTRRAAYFDNDGKILFIDSSDSILKKMDPDGTNITTIATPESPYSFSIFWMSPDREKIILVEDRQEGPDYFTGHYTRLVLMNTDGTGRTVIKDEFLGDWNQVVWKPDSSEILYYHHIFDVVGGVYQGKIPKYVLIDISDGTKTDLSNSDMGKEENICIYTKWGNLLSLTYRELFNGETGDLIRDVSGAPSYVPLFMESMGGWDNQGEIYFADLDGSNFRRFVEPLKGDINKDGVVDISDVILVLRIALQLDPLNPCSDINNDGVVDISDVILTLRMALGLDPMQECG